MTETTQFLIHHGLPLVFAAVFLEQMGLPLPALPWLLAAGALSATGQFSLLLGLAVTVVACLVADGIWFYLGRYRGNQVLGLLCRISLEPDSCVRRTQNVFTRYGLRSVLVAKFVPGLSTVAPPLAGMAGVGAGRFLFVDAVGSLLYGGCFIFLGYFFSSQIQQIGEALAGIGGSALGLLAGLAGLYIGFKLWQRQRLLRELRMSRITVDELHRKQEAGEDVMVLDLRSRAAVEQDPAIIRGAVRFSLDDIEKRQHELPRDREIIVYCSCPNEVSSARLALLLQREGFARVRPLLGGIDAWREQNYPLEPRPSDGASTIGTVPLCPEAVVATVAALPLPGGNEDHPAKGGNATVSILLAAAALLWVAGCKPKSHVTPPPPIMEVAPLTQANSLLTQRMPDIPAGLPFSLLERRPDLRQAGQLLRSSNAQVGESVAKIFPKIGLTTFPGKVSLELSAFTLGSANAWGIAAEATGPLFEGGRLVGQCRQAKAARQEATWQYQQAILNAFREVSDGLVSRQQLADVREHQAHLVRALEKAVKLSSERHVAGKASYYEVIETQQQLFPPELNLARTQRDELVAVVALCKGLSGGWQDEMKPYPHP
jgi:membrane protein DedA with SNARE-associated domain/rhodanese-related sulfurtransferase